MSAMNLKYKFGLINSAGRYLTAEKFGGKVNASGASLKLKQVWTLEQDENVSYLKSHTGNYLSADKNGNVYCDCDDRANNKDTGFSIEIQDDGKWALKNVTHGRYLSCNNDELICNQSSDSNPAVHWTVQLAIHPQVCMKNVQQQLYAHLKRSEDGEDRVVADEMVPWGADSTLTLVYGGKGKYCLEAFNGKFVQSDGQLVDSINEKTEYTLIFNSGNLQLRDNSRSFLGVDSGTKVLRSTSKMTKATSFVLEDSCPQGAFVLGEKYASLKQGEDVSFKLLVDEEIEDTETFQLEFVKTDTYAIRVCDFKKNREAKYWKRYAAGIQANGTSKDQADCQFAVEYEGKYMRLRAPGGKYVGVRDNGHLLLQDSPKDFIFRLINRPKLVLKCTHGFVGAKDGKVACNRSNFDVFTVTYKDGGYTIQDSNGKYWSCDDSQNTKPIVLGEAPGIFFFEFHELSKFAIRAEGGDLIKGEQSGLFTANGTNASSSDNTLWEF